MNTLTIGIVTSPREKRYLHDTIIGINQAARDTVVDLVISPNFIDPMLDGDLTPIGMPGNRLTAEVLEALVPRTLAEENTRLGHAGLGVKGERIHRGIQRNTDRLMDHLITRGSFSSHAPGGQPFLILQDDVIFCPQAIDRIAQIAAWLASKPSLGRQDAIGCISFYSPYREFSRSRTALIDYPVGKFYGELATLWHPACAQQFLGVSNHNEAHDLEIQRYFQSFRPAQPWRLMAHSPCLVQHCGDVSARGDAQQGCVRTPNFNPHHRAVADGLPLQ